MKFITLSLMATGLYAVDPCPKQEERIIMNTKDGKIYVCKDGKPSPPFYTIPDLSDIVEQLQKEVKALKQRISELEIKNKRSVIHQEKMKDVEK